MLTLRRVLLRQSDLLVDLSFLLFPPLLVLLWFLDELSCLRVTRLQFGLDCLVLPELLTLASVTGTLSCTATLLARESSLHLSLLLLWLLSLLSLLSLLALVLISLVTHSCDSVLAGSGSVLTHLFVSNRTDGSDGGDTNCSTWSDIADDGSIHHWDQDIDPYRALNEYAINRFVRCSPKEPLLQNYNRSYR